MKKLALIFCIAMLAACTKPAYITITSPASVKVGASGDRITVTFSTNRDWVASTATGWATVASRNGVGGDVSLTVSVSPSYETDERSVDLIITAEDAKASVRIVQEPPAIVELDKTSFRVDSKGGYLDIGLRANTAYNLKIEGSPDWLRVVSTKGLEAHTAEIAIDPNKTTIPRTATIQFTGGISLEEVTITQDGSDQSFAITHQARDFFFPLLGGELAEGSVDWGYEGARNTYASGMEFSYPDDGERHVVFSGRNVVEVTVLSLTDITGLDFSKL